MFWLLAAAAIGAGLSGGDPLPADSRQLVVVVTPSWSATSGALYRYARQDSASRWVLVGAPVRVVVGRAGLGWGMGLHGGVGSGPVKAEGDGRAPAGAFALTESFGYAPADSARTGLPYVAAGPDIECVDDVRSAHYNRIVDRREVAVDWQSHEEMRRRDVLYRRGVVVAHNASPTVPSAGSCIFLHVWRGPGSTTSGCTAMPEPEMASLAAWLEAEASPVLVQLPVRVYRELRQAWALPRLP